MGRRRIAITTRPAPNASEMIASVEIDVPAPVAGSTAGIGTAVVTGTAAAGVVTGTAAAGVVAVAAGTVVVAVAAGTVVVTAGTVVVTAGTVVVTAGTVVVVTAGRAATSTAPDSDRDLGLVIVLFRRERHTDQFRTATADHDDRPILALLWVLFERNPCPHHLAGVRVAIHPWRILDRDDAFRRQVRA